MIKARYFWILFIAYLTLFVAWAVTMALYWMEKTR